jgi:5-methylcytosine-specific restriction endonuclease McrA
VEKRVLVLTNWYMPYQVLRWQDAVRLVYTDAASVVAEYGDELRSPSVVWKMPAVIRLRRAIGATKKGIKFSRVNVYARDGFRCQYCGARGVPRELTYDHVVPRCRGGRTVWDNIVTACRPCNNRKGRLTCDEAGMFPLRAPVKPRTLPTVSPVVDVERAPAEWIDFLRPYLPVS